MVGNDPLNQYDLLGLESCDPCQDIKIKLKYLAMKNTTDRFGRPAFTNVDKFNPKYGSWTEGGLSIPDNQSFGVRVEIERPQTTKCKCIKGEDSNEIDGVVNYSHHPYITLTRDGEGDKNYGPLWVPYRGHGMDVFSGFKYRIDEYIPRPGKIYPVDNNNKSLRVQVKMRSAEGGKEFVCLDRTVTISRKPSPGEKIRKSIGIILKNLVNKGGGLF
jgi:hypothetical protein